MNTLEQDPEEIPMDQVLAEIRQMLGTEAVKEAESQHTEVPPPPQPLVMDRVSPPMETPAFSVSDKAQTSADYFLLTPAMRCDLPSDSELSQSVQKQTVRVLNKLQQQSATELSPALIEWLNANLPNMIEKVLANRESGAEGRNSRQQ